MEEQPDSRREAGLVKRIARGDRDAMAELARLYQHRLLRFVRKMVAQPEDAEECVVDILLAVWNGAERFEGRSRVSTWIFGIARRKALDRIEPHRREAFISFDEALPIPSPAPDPEAAALQSESDEAVRAAIDQLSPEHRAVIHLAFREGRSYGEIAEIMGCPVNTVKTRVHYAKERLKQLLAGGGERR
jgi:RNA polymerase sigma-70 factor (ECF subfamily)